MYFKNLYLKIRYSTVLRLIFDGISRLGIRLSPYYLFREVLRDSKNFDTGKGFENYEIGFFSSGDMKEIASLPGRNIPETTFHERLGEGQLCFGAKYEGRIVSFSWCDMNKVNSMFLRRVLEQDEAYLFDAFTVMAFRGKGIAPYLRHQFYKELSRLGRSKLYSISDAFNTPAVNFKKKLNAELIELGLYVEVLKKWRFNTTLRRYDGKQGELRVKARD